MTYVNRRGGRPTIFTPELGREICQRISGGATLREIARCRDMPAVSTITSWILLYRDTFGEEYVVARQQQAFILADELVGMITDLTKDIPDGQAGMPTVIARKEQINSVRWLLTKVLRSHFGEKAEASAQSNGGPRVVIHLPATERTTREYWEAIGHEVTDEPLPPISELEGRPRQLLGNGLSEDEDGE